MKTLYHPIDCGVAVLGISKAIMGSFWYRLIDKFGEDHVQLVYTDTYSLVIILIGDTYNEADILTYIRKEPDFAFYFDLDGVPDVPTVAPSYTYQNMTKADKRRFSKKALIEYFSTRPLYRKYYREIWHPNEETNFSNVLLHFRKKPEEKNDD